jgi:hypothetical protein
MNINIYFDNIADIKRGSLLRSFVFSCKIEHADDEGVVISLGLRADGP